MRWGIVGMGWVARDYVAPAMKTEGHEIVAIADPDPEAATVAAGFGAARHGTAEALIAAGGLDALYVATPNHLHADPTVAALEAGIPVLCEKPMAASLEDAERIAAAAKETATLYGTAFDQRHHPAHGAMADAIADGRIGTPLAVRIVYACWVDPLFAPKGGENWRIDAGKAGGGATIDLALHGLDLTQRLTGGPVTTLTMALQRRIHDYDVDDGGALAGRTADGVLLTSHVAYNCPETMPRRRLEVLGTGGLLSATDTMGQTAGGTVVLRREDGPTERIDFDVAVSPFARQVAAFAAAVRGEAHDFDAGRDLDLMRLFDRAHREARSCL